MIGYNFIEGGVQKLFAQLDCGAQQGTPAGQKYFEIPPPVIFVGYIQIIALKRESLKPCSDYVRNVRIVGKDRDRKRNQRNELVQTLLYLA